VWDVRIEGNEQLPKSVIEKALENVGVAPGVGWGSFKVSDKELELLESTPEIGWVNINRRGVVAYVTVKERNLKEDSSEPLYSNVVSAYDCVIEEITVTSGVAVVKAGDTVRRGDLLISGVIPAELGGGFVAARGEVCGRMREEISVSVSRTEEKTVYERAQISEIRLKIFSFLINIYKKYGNLDRNYVIIEEEIGLASPSGHRLPFKVYKTYREYVSKKEVSYTDDELVSITGERLVGKRAAALVGAELISISTSGDFTDEGYSMSCRMTLLRNIGETVGITEDEGKK
jgi:sporulation protein YqfD